MKGTIKIINVLSGSLRIKDTLTATLRVKDALTGVIVDSCKSVHPHAFITESGETLITESVETLLPN